MAQRWNLSEDNMLGVMGSAMQLEKTEPDGCIKIWFFTRWRLAKYGTNPQNREGNLRLYLGDTPVGHIDYVPKYIQDELFKQFPKSRVPSYWLPEGYGGV